MDWNLVGWLAAAACAFGAASLFARTRVLTRQVAEAAARAREFRERLKTSEKRFDQRAKQGRQRGEETGELRRKLEKARKRAGQAREEQRADAERARKLEAELHLREADLRAARAENTAPPSEVEKREVEKREVEKPNQPTQAAPALPPPPPAPAPQPVVPEAVLERAEKAEDDARRYAKELGKLRQDLERSRVRQRAESKAYMALRGELEAKKDRLRHQQEELERLRAMKVVLGSPDADESPPEPPAASETGPALGSSGASNTNPG